MYAMRHRPKQCGARMVFPHPSVSQSERTRNESVHSFHTSMHLLRNTRPGLGQGQTSMWTYIANQWKKLSLSSQISNQWKKFSQPTTWLFIIKPLRVIVHIQLNFNWIFNSIDSDVQLCKLVNCAYKSLGQLTGHMNMSKDYCPYDRAIPYSFNSSRLKIILRMLFQDHVFASVITDIVIGYWQDMWLKITAHEPSQMQMGPCSMIVYLYVVFT